jgi:methylated-DNA-protein-cysteine methyltransferase related protein
LRADKENNKTPVITFEEIYKIVAKIPKGKVMSYKQIAKLVKTTPRIVGFALHANKNPNTVPCHRVVFSNGALSKGYAYAGINSQKAKLINENVLFINKNFVNLKECLFKY